MVFVRKVTAAVEGDLYKFMEIAHLNTLGKLYLCWYHAGGEKRAPVEWHGKMGLYRGEFVPIYHDNTGYVHFLQITNMTMFVVLVIGEEGEEGMEQLNELMGGMDIV